MFKWLYKLLTAEVYLCRWTAAASVAGSAISGAMSKSASSKAAGQSAKASAASQAQIAAQRKENNAFLAPFEATGYSANNKLADYLGLESPSTAYSGAKSDYDLAVIAYQNALSDKGDQNPSGFDWSLPNQAPTAAWGYAPTGGNYDNSAAIAAAKQRMDDAQARMGSVNPNADHSENFGSLLQNFTGEDLQNEPGYQFGLGEGEKGINRATAARGGWDSGATLKALAKYNQDYAGTKFGDAFNRDTTNKNRIYSFLSGASSQGQNAATSNASMNSGLVTGAAANTQAAGNTAANYTMQGAAGLNNGIQSGIGNYLYDQRVNNGSVVSAPAASSYGSSSMPAWYA
jgi:hypothetical protein